MIAVLVTFRDLVIRSFGQEFIAMVTLGDARRSALHEGPLEKKRRTGGWKKRFFVLTPTHFCYFDSAAEDTAVAKSSLATFDILSVDAPAGDATQRVLLIHLYRKKKEYRTLTPEEREPWLRALASVAAFKPDGTKNDPLPIDTPQQQQQQQQELQQQEIDVYTQSTAQPAARRIMDRSGVAGTARTTSDTLVIGPGNTVDLPKLCERMKKVFTKQPQTSKSFSSRDVVEFVCKATQATAEQARDIGQQLIDAKLLVPLKSHIFDDDDDGSSRFKFFDAATQQRQPKNHLSMRSQSIQELMGTSHFDASRYAEDFLRKHASDKIDQHCTNLLSQKDKTIEALKQEISANYQSFIRASAEIKTMENSVSQLQTLVLEGKRSIHTLQSVALHMTLAKAPPPPAFQLADQLAHEHAQRAALDGALHDLEVALHQHAYADFAARVLDFRRALQQNPQHASASQQRRVERLVEQFTRRLVDEFNASMQTSERMHKKEEHLQLLIQLGEPALATDMCLQNYSVRIALQLRHVPSYGNALNYVINLSRTFFTSLLVCYQDYEHSFRGQTRSHFISLTVWISAQLERFANELLGHIFPGDATATAIDVAAFKNVAKFVGNALRYVFYGARQLELAGLPTAHGLAPHLVKGILALLASYSAAIRAASKDEVKRERWEMARRTIRDAETKQDREIILTHSARSFYSMVQQFLRDMQRVLNPSCATSALPQVHEAVVAHADELLVRYSTDVLNYLENPKLSSSVRFKHVVGLLTNVAYIQDDCAARATLILHEYLPTAALQNRELVPQNAKLWRRLVVLGMQKGAQSLLKMSIGWVDLDLSEETLPDMTIAKETKPLFVTVLLCELAEVSNQQLEKMLRKYRNHDQDTTTDDDADDGDDTQVLLATMVLEGMLVEMTQDENWWQQLRKTRRIGYAGLNKFAAELRVLSESAQSSKVIDEVGGVLVKLLTDAYRQTHPGDAKKDLLAPENWTKGYVKMCMHQLEQQAAAMASTATITN